MTSDEKTAAAAAMHDADDAADDKSVGKVSIPNMTHMGLPEVLRGLSPEELKALEKKLVRKIDIRLLPTMILICKQPLLY